MKRTCTFFFCLIPLLCLSQLEKIEDFGSNPGNLKMYVHEPERNGKAKNPLLIALHGCSQNASSFSKQTGWNYLADSAGFYVVYPETELFNNPSLCFNWFKKRDINTNNGECGSVAQMLKYMQNNFPIDSNRVYVMGVSAGAAMATVMMANYPNKFAAGAVIAGGPYKSATSYANAAKSMAGWVKNTPEEWGSLVKEQNPEYDESYPKMIILHGNEDKIVNPKSSNELMKQWSWLHTTDTVPEMIEKKYEGNNLVTRETYLSKKGKPAIIYYKINELGHALPVDSSKIHAGNENKLFTKNIGWSAILSIAKDFNLLDL